MTWRPFEPSREAVAEAMDSMRRFGSCPCEFCTGTKRWEDNWCPCCGDVQMQPPKSYENFDVCDDCEKKLTEAT